MIARPARRSRGRRCCRSRTRRSSCLPQHTLLPLDDCLYALQATIPHLTRSSLHRCLQRHGISRLPEVEGDKPSREEVQDLPDRLLPHRHRRGADRRRQALSVRRHRPDEQVRLRAAGREAPPPTTAIGLPARPDRGRSLQDPHRADRQRHPVHDPALAHANGPTARLHDAHVRHALPRERHRAPRSPRSSIRGPTARSSG